MAPVGGAERGCAVPDLNGGVSALGLTPRGDAGWDGATLCLDRGVSSLGHLRERLELSRGMAQAGGERCGLRTDCAALPAAYGLTGGSEGVQALPEPSMRDMHAGDGSLTKLRQGEVGVKPADPQASRKQKQYLFLQTVNHAKVIWDSQIKPKGILGGHLNIRSIIAKEDRIHTLLTESNVDYLCLS